MTLNNILKFSKINSTYEILENEKGKTKSVKLQLRTQNFSIIAFTFKLPACRQTGSFSLCHSGIPHVEVSHILNF